MNGSDGTMEFNTFLDEFDRLAKKAGWGEREQVVSLLAFIHTITEDIPGSHAATLRSFVDMEDNEH